MKKMNFMEKTMVVFRRFFELIVFEILASAGIALMVDAQVIHEKSIFAIVVVVFFVIFIAINVHQTRNCYFDLRDKLWHNVLNITAYLLLAAISFLVYKFLPYDVYRMTFSLANVFKYVYTPCPIILSAILFHITNLLAIILAPLGMEDFIANVSWMEDEETIDEEF